MRILVTNDDGIYAPGLKVLEKIARELSKDVWVVAPEVEQSGAAHSLTLRSPLRFEKHGARKFSVRGTPTDCVLSAALAIVPEKIDLVLSGVNRGGNVAEDLSHSGTVAAAMEAALCGIPAIALSQLIEYDRARVKIHWETAAKFAPVLIRKILREPWVRDTLYNINFPNCAPGAVKGTKVAPQGRRAISKELTRAVDPNNRPYYWLHWGDEKVDARRPGTDIEYLYKHYITVTPVSMDMTNYSLLEKARKHIEK